MKMNLLRNLILGCKFIVNIFSCALSLFVFLCCDYTTLFVASRQILFEPRRFLALELTGFVICVATLKIIPILMNYTSDHTL